MLMIRLARRGTRNHPFYDIVVAEKTSARDGRFVEKVGYYNPIISDPSREVFIDMSKIEKRIKEGAQMSATVARLHKKFKKISVAQAQTSKA